MFSPPRVRAISLEQRNLKPQNLQIVVIVHQLIIRKPQDGLNFFYQGLIYNPSGRNS
jgi:hypothetical protein